MRLLSLFPRSLKAPLLLILLVSLSITLASLVFYFTIQPTIPVFYTLPQAESQLVAKEWIFLFPLISILVAVGHLVILTKLLELEKVVVNIFTWTTFIVQILLLMAFFRIMVIIS